MSAWLDRALAFELRHERAISLIMGGYFVLGCAAYAGFITLPAIAFVSDQALFWGSIGLNAGWWGFVRPAIERRRDERELAQIGAQTDARER